MSGNVEVSNKGPFIPSELRPAVGPESSEETPALDPHATKVEIAKAAQVVLAEEEQAQIERNKGLDPNAFSKTFITPSPDVHCTVLDEEAVLLNLENGLYYTLNRVGTATWELFTGDKTLSEIHGAICSRFEVAEDRARNDLVALVNHLGQEGLIQQERR